MLTSLLASVVMVVVPVKGEGSSFRGGRERELRSSGSGVHRV